jgi:AAHS family 4-hydroxybenzoate transporter-like MFS transporter
MDSATRTIDLRALIDDGRMRPLQVLVAVLCGICLLLDGFDVQSIGFVAPAIAEEWSIQPAALGVVFASGLLGMVIGTSVFSWAADWSGRRPMLIGATLLAGAAMGLTSRAADVNQLMILRLITGVGLGALVPNAFALASEYIPSRVRTAVLMVMGCGLALGAALGGWLTSVVISAWGWRSVFMVGGAGPILVGLLMLATLPESLRLMVLRGAPERRIRRLLRRLDPSALESDASIVVAVEPEEGRASPLELFRHGRGRTTALLWLVGFTSLLELYFIANWLPSVIRGAGHALGVAVLAGGAVLQGAGVIGALNMARLGGRTPLRRMLMISYLVASGSIYLIGQSIGTLPFLFLTVFVTGFCVVGAQLGLNVYSAGLYPAYIRSTGVGWMLAIGRCGSIAGPLIGGVILQLHLGPAALFGFATLPALIAAAGMFAIGRLAGPGPSQEMERE